MAVPIRLRNVPEHLRSAHLTDYCDAPTDTQGIKSHGLLQFPQSTCVLWDGTSTGSPVFLHVAQDRRPRLLLCEKLLWLIHKQVDSEGSANKVLVGSLCVEQDADGVSFKIDRLDTRQTDVNASLLQDDVLIPVQISTNSSQQGNGGSKEDYAEAIKMLQKRCSSHETLELNNLLLVKGWCSVRSHQHAEQIVVHLQFDVVTLGNVFKATPVNPVPIIPSALAKNLAGPRNLSHMQGRPKMGYLSMDATRKLLLVLETDPKVASLPVVGIWVSGVSMVHHPFVWGSCLRYLQNERLQDRVCSPPESFLLMVYSSMHSKPEFYEISTTSGKSDLQFDLYTGYEVTTLSKKSSGPDVLEWELNPVKNGPKRQMFDAALECVRSQGQGGDSGRTRPSLSTSEDIVPRMTPAPHQSKTVTIRPMVPELSMIWNDDSIPSRSLQPFSSAPNPPARLNTAFSAPCSTPALNFTAPVSMERKQMGLVPSTLGKNCLVSGDMPKGSGASNCCDPGKAPQQDSDCMPRTGFPAQYAQPHIASDQNNSERTCLPAFSSSSGCSGTACGNYVPQLSIVPHQHVAFQADNEYRTGEVPRHSSQGPACVLQQQCHQQQQMYNPGAFMPQPQPQNHPRPRLMAPAGMHFTRPTLAGPAVRSPHSLPHSSVGALRPPHSSSVPHSVVSQGQHFPVSVPSNHPNAYIPGHFLMQTHCSSIPQAVNLSPAAMGQTNDIPKYLNSVQGTPAPLQPSQEVLTQQGYPSANIFPQQTRPDLQSGFSPYAQFAAGKQTGTQPSFSLAHRHLQPDRCVSTIPVGTQSHEPTAEAATDSHHSDNTSSSTKSSNDSGLSVTPERCNPSPKTSHFVSPQVQLEVSGAQASGLESVNWAGVPSEVVQLLVQQDAQLKMLQAQMQQLLSQQHQAAAPSPASNISSTPTLVEPSSNLSTPSTLKRETCSTAVNTTLFKSGSPWITSDQGTQCTSIQTSPQKLPPPHPHRHSHSTSFHLQDAPPSPPRLLSTGATTVVGVKSSRSRSPSMQEAVGVGETPAELRHQGPVQLSSTEHEEVTGKTSSLHSTGSLERPSPVRSVESHLQLSNSTPSPLSASMCVRPDESEEESGAQEVSPDSKEYYDQLINNIRLFLNSHSQDADNTDANRTDTVTATEEDTTAGLKMFDSTVDMSPSQPAVPSGGVNSSSNTTMIPHINYLSMMLGSDSDASMEINAMAMKYLRDEQLTQVARHHQSPHRAGSSHLLLRQALAASLDTTGTSDVSRLGMSATNLSMATKKYLEKHGLLGGGQGESLLDTNQTIRLQTDFSLAVMSESQSTASLPSSPQKGAGHANVQSPVKREMLKPLFKPSPVIAEERPNKYAGNDRKCLGDLGASPVLRPPGRYHRDPSPEDSPIFPERHYNPQQQQFIDGCSVATDDDRILDIEKLKQMPKLL